jgi:hypothetical protein
MLIIYGLRIVNVFKHRWKFERSKKIMKNIGDETKYKTHKKKEIGPEADILGQKVALHILLRFRFDYRHH